MTNHKHIHCKHDLKYCDICDTVYCEKCGKEWKYNPYTFTYTTPTIYYTATNSGDKPVTNTHTCSN